MDEPELFTECDTVGVDHKWSTHPGAWCIHCGVGMFRALNFYRKEYLKSQALQTRLKEAEALLNRCEEIITDAPAFSAEEQDRLSQVLEKIEAFRDREKPE